MVCARLKVILNVICIHSTVIFDLVLLKQIFTDDLFPEPTEVGESTSMF